MPDNGSLAPRYPLACPTAIAALAPRAKKIARVELPVPAMASFRLRDGQSSIAKCMPSIVMALSRQRRRL